MLVPDVAGTDVSAVQGSAFGDTTTTAGGGTTTTTGGTTTTTVGPPFGGLLIAIVCPLLQRLQAIPFLGDVLIPLLRAFGC